MQLLENVNRIMAQLEYEVDVRNPPDEFRRRQFRAGWGDACNRDKVNSPLTLKQLTWRNAGYRVGLQLGGISHEDIDKVVSICPEPASTGGNLPYLAPVSGLLRAKLAKKGVST